jgi:transposase InsO family protein
LNRRGWSYQRNFGWLLLVWLLATVILTAIGLCVFTITAALEVSNFGGLSLSDFAGPSERSSEVNTVLVLTISFLIVQLLAIVFFASFVETRAAIRHLIRRYTEYGPREALGHLNPHQFSTPQRKVVA